VACYPCFHRWMVRKGGCLPQAEVAELVNEWCQYSSETKVYWFASHSQHVIFFSFWICFILTEVSKVIFASLAGLEMWVTQIFLLFFHNSFFFVYRHSDLEGSCSNGTKTACESRCCLRAVAGHEIWHWAERFETFTERICWAYDACVGEVLLRVASLSPCFRGGLREWSIVRTGVAQY